MKFKSHFVDLEIGYDKDEDTVTGGSIRISNMTVDSLFVPNYIMDMKTVIAKYDKWVAKLEKERNN